MDELNRMFISHNTTLPTQKINIQTFKKIHSIYPIDRPLHTISITTIKHILSNPDLSVSYKHKIINLFMLLKREYDPTMDDLFKLNELLTVVKDDKLTKKVSDFKELDTDLYDEIQNYIHSPEVLHNPTTFITNWLVFYLNTRNADLIVQIIDATKIISLDLDADKNYLIYYPTHVEFIRNNYKTVKTYGSKINIITDPLFIDAVGKMSNGYLLADNQADIGYAVRSKLYTHNGKHLTEIRYLENNITHFKNDINKLKQIEHNRGSDVSTLLTSYNKDFTNQKY